MNRKKTKILFVDDDANLLAGLRRLLRSFSEEWDVTFQSNAIEALAVLKNEPVDFVVSDIRMPKMDGVEFMSHIQSDFPDVVRIILSGQAEKEKVVQLPKLVHQYFAKPCNPQRLHQIIQTIRKSQEELGCDELAAALTGLRSIPVLRQHYDALVTAIVNSENNRLASIVSQDIGLSTKLRQLAGSHFVGTPRPSSSIEELCQCLGPETIKSMVTSSDSIEISETPDNGNKKMEQEICQRILGHCHFDTESRAHEILSQSGQGVSEYLFALWGIEVDAAAFPQSPVDQGTAILPTNADLNA